MRKTAFLAICFATLIAFAPAAPALAETVTQQVSFPAGSDGTSELIPENRTVTEAAILRLLVSKNEEIRI